MTCSLDTRNRRRNLVSLKRAGVFPEFSFKSVQDFMNFLSERFARDSGRSLPKDFPKNSANRTWEVVSKGFNTPILCYSRYTVLVPDTCKPQESWDLKSLDVTSGLEIHPRTLQKRDPTHPFLEGPIPEAHFGTIKKERTGKSSMVSS